MATLGFHTCQPFLNLIKVNKCKCIKNEQVMVENPRQMHQRKMRIREAAFYR